MEKGGGSERRRSAILVAARRLLTSQSLSMRQIAVAAGVAPATPYNLFGTKRRIFLALYSEINADLRVRTMADAKDDALDRVYRAVALVAADLAAEPVFFRALFAVVFASGSKDDDATEADPAVAFWHDLMSGMQAQGIIAREVNVGTFTQNFVYVLAGATIDWTEGRIDATALHQAVLYGFTLSTMAIATETSRPRLQRVLATFDGKT